MLQRVIKELLKKLIARCDFLGMNLCITRYPLFSSHSHKIKTFKLFLTGTNASHPERFIICHPRPYNSLVLWSYENSISFTMWMQPEKRRFPYFPALSSYFTTHFQETRTGKLQRAVKKIFLTFLRLSGVHLSPCSAVFHLQAHRRKSQAVTPCQKISFSAPTPHRELVL
jgi:hypothetical protein